MTNLAHGYLLGIVSNILYDLLGSPINLLLIILQIAQFNLLRLPQLEQAVGTLVRSMQLLFFLLEDRRVTLDVLLNI